MLFFLDSSSKEGYLQKSNICEQIEETLDNIISFYYFSGTFFLLSVKSCKNKWILLKMKTAWSPSETLQFFKYILTHI